MQSQTVKMQIRGHISHLAWGCFKLLRWITCFTCLLEEQDVIVSLLFGLYGSKSFREHALPNKKKEMLIINGSKTLSET